MDSTTFRVELPRDGSGHPLKDIPLGLSAGAEVGTGLHEPEAKLERLTKGVPTRYELGRDEQDVRSGRYDDWCWSSGGFAS